MAKDKRRGTGGKKEVKADEKPPANGKCDILNLTKNQILIFLLEFLVVAAALLIVWWKFYLGEFYQSAVFAFSKPFPLLMGYTKEQIAALNLGKAYLVNFNLVPLFALAIATPKLILKKRLEILAIGVPILFLLHVTDILVRFPMYIDHSKFAAMVYASIGIVGIAVPFIIWFVIAVSFRSVGKK
ncbi:hypothetical protein C5S31_12355 [ANME-1 cluster archaeon GoMg2]|nr:hypothetical protein [ANME-1 cluster archaeon GoMg2]